MGCSEPDPATGSLQPRLQGVRPRRRWATVVIVALVLAWVAAMWFRWEIRAAWWAYRLTQVETPEDRQYYLARLAAKPDKSLGAVDRLIHDPRPEVRGMAVTVLERCESGEADEHLLRLLADRDDVVGARAALALASREGASAHLPTLRRYLCEDDGPLAGNAAVALQRIGGPEAERALLEALIEGRDPDLLAQVIESLGMLGSREAVPELTRLLKDERPVTTLPYAQRSALQALTAQQGKLLEKGLDAREAIEGLRGKTTVAAVAAIALRWITGAPPGRPTTQPVASGPALP